MSTLLEIKAIFVDFDGTLADTRTATAAAYSAACRSFGVKVTADEFLKTRGQSYEDFLPPILGKMRIDLLEPIASKKSEIYLNYVHLVRINEPLVRTLLGYRSRLIPIGLVSNARRSSVEPLIERSKIKYVFDFMITREDFARPKPAPDAYSVALTRVECEASKTIAFEDSWTGFLSAHRAGIGKIDLTHAI
jgi:beta-phosphoglucomutase-like phosphatase (HAD superfamily)